MGLGRVSRLAPRPGRLTIRIVDSHQDAVIEVEHLEDERSASVHHGVGHDLAGEQRCLLDELSMAPLAYAVDDEVLGLPVQGPPVLPPE